MYKYTLKYLFYESLDKKQHISNWSFNLYKEMLECLNGKQLSSKLFNK